MAEYELNDEAIELIVLIHRIFSDSSELPYGVDVAYLVGETEDNQDSVFLTGMNLMKSKNPFGFSVGWLGISNGPTGHGYPGFTAWKKELLQYSGIEDRMILSIPYHGGEQFNTYTEAKEFIRNAKERRWTSACITAALFHHVRAFITFVSIALVEYPEISLYSVPGAVLEWGEFVRHSQGLQMGMRIDILRDEMKKLYRYYHETKSLVPVREILAYFERRDR